MRSTMRPRQHFVKTKKGSVSTALSFDAVADCYSRLPKNCSRNMNMLMKSR